MVDAPGPTRWMPSSTITPSTSIESRVPTLARRGQALEPAWGVRGRGVRFGRQFRHSGRGSGHGGSG